VETYFLHFCKDRAMAAGVQSPLLGKSRGASGRREKKERENDGFLFAYLRNILHFCGQ
jgi:hypothetical protein